MKKTSKAKYALLSVGLAAALAFTAFVPVACSCTPIEAPEFEIKKIIDFADGANTDVFFASDGWNNGGSFNVEWDASAVTYEDDVAKLSVIEAPESATKPYYGAELRSAKWYHYGYYSVSMKPSNVPGSVSTFFTYTGPSELGADGEANPWDEIDIEFLGTDTTRVQFNYYVDGNNTKKGHEKWYDLGFDASEAFHTYGFLWEKDRITWYVDNEPVYQVEREDSAEGIPETPSRIMMSHWVVNEDGEKWAGAAYDGSATESVYQWVGCTSEPQDPYVEETPEVPAGDVTFTAGEDIGLTFVNSDNVGNPYTIDQPEDKKSAEVTYTEIGQTYANLVAAVADEDEGKNAYGMTLTNNGEAAVNVRVDVRDTVNIVSDSSGVTYPETPRHSCLNTNAFYREAGTEEWTSATTDNSWGGSTFVFEAGKTYELIVVYDTETFTCQDIVLTGEYSVSDITIFIDSHVANGPYSGDVKIEHINFGTATVTEGEEPETPVEPPVTTVNIEQGATYQVNPIEDAATVAFENYTGNTSDGTYTVEKGADNKSATITYTKDGVLSSWKNAAVDYAPEAGTNVFVVKIKNNGDVTANVRINMMTYSPEQATLNAGATQDGVGVLTDIEYGGSFFTVNAGATITAVVYYTGAPTQVQFMIDSHVSDLETVSGSITISDFAFGTATPVKA